MAHQLIEKAKEVVFRRNLPPPIQSEIICAQTELTHLFASASAPTEDGKRFVGRPALYSEIVAAACLFEGEKFFKDVVKMLEDLRGYLASLASGVLDKPALIELQRAYIAAHVAVYGLTPKAEIETLHGGADSVPDVLKDILMAARSWKQVRPPRRDRQTVKSCGSSPTTTQTRAHKPGDVIMTAKGPVVVPKRGGPNLTLEQQAERRLINAAERLKHKQNRAGAAALRKVKKAEQKKAAEASENKKNKNK